MGRREPRGTDARVGFDPTKASIHEDFHRAATARAVLQFPCIMVFSARPALFASAFLTAVAGVASLQVGCGAPQEEPAAANVSDLRRDGGAGIRGASQRKVTGEIFGDVIVTVAESPVEIEDVVVHGNVIVQPGATLRWTSRDAVSRIEGGLDVGAGSTVLCNFLARWDKLEVTGHSHFRGTKDAPIEVEGGGWQNACWLELASVDVSYASFVHTPIRFGAPSTVRDSEFAPDSPTGWSWIVTATGAPADDVVIEYNRFISTELRGNGYTATHNEFISPESGISIIVSDGQVENGACTGDRSRDAAIVMKENVFNAPYEKHVFQVDRGFGRLDFTRNNFTNNNFMDDRWTLRAWEGYPTGCPDGRGAYGGPILWKYPIQNFARPIVGPR